VPITIFTPTDQSVLNLRSMGHSGEGYQERDNQQRCLQRSEALEANGVRVSPSNASSTRVALCWELGWDAGDRVGTDDQRVPYLLQVAMGPHLRLLLLVGVFDD